MAKKISHSMDWTTIAAVLIVVLGFLAAINYIFPGASSDRTVSVTGTAEMSVSPDRVVVYLQVLTRSNVSADEAKDLNANISDAVMASLLAVGVNSSNIETSGFSVYPEYDWTQDKGQVLKGYAASNSMQVTFSDIEEAGEIVDAAVDSGALVSYINYELSTAKLNEYKAEVLSDASKDAKAKAESIAAGLGKSLGDIVSVSSSDYNYVPYYAYRADSSGAYDVQEVATNLPSANVDVTATVSVTYKIA